MQNVLNYKTILENIKEEVKKIRTISELKKLELYDEIYDLYGQKAYLKSVPAKYRELEIEDLIEDREFEEIFKKYGAKVYNSYLLEMNEKENFDEYGKDFVDRKIKFHYYDLKYLKYLLTIGALVIMGIPAVDYPVINFLLNIKSEVIYHDMIEQYNSEVAEYANYVNSLGLNDLETIMKVIDDSWDKIEKFGDSYSEVYGYFRLNMMDEKPVVLCRHIADDVGAKLNAINPEYNARDINVVLDTNKVVAIPNSLVNIVSEKTEEYNRDRNSHSGIQTFGFSNIQSIDFNPQSVLDGIIGNHMVLLVDIKDDNLTLVVDPTIPGIGIYDNGQIYMFSTEDGKGYTNPIFEQFIYGPDREIDYWKTKILSYNYNNIEELNKKWGLDACNIALDNVHDIAKEMSEKGYTYTKK